MDPQVQGLIQQIALAIIAVFSSMAGLLVWLIKQQASQIEKMSERFTGALETTIRENTTAQIHMTDGLIDINKAMMEQTTTLREFMSNARENHREVITSIGKATMRSQDAA